MVMVIYARTSDALWSRAIWSTIILYIVLVGCGGSLVDSTPFVRMVMGSNPAEAAMKGPWARPFHSQLPVALRCVNSGTVSVLCLERHRVVVDLNRRYRNILNKYIK